VYLTGATSSTTLNDAGTRPPASVLAYAYPEAYFRPANFGRLGTRRVFKRLTPTGGTLVSESCTTYHHFAPKRPSCSGDASRLSSRLSTGPVGRGRRSGKATALLGRARRRPTLRARVWE